MLLSILLSILLCAAIAFYFKNEFRKSHLRKRSHNVVITGSTKGIGLALAKYFLLKGHNVIISGRNQTAVDSKVEELKSGASPSAKIFGLACDVRDEKDLQNLANFSILKLGHITMWINNAGVTQSLKTPLHETPPDTIRSIIETNLLGMLLGNRSAIQMMLKNPDPSGERMHIFSMDGAGTNGMTTPTFCTYGASKAGFIQIKNTLVKEMKDENIGIHLLSPGMVTTDLLLGDKKLDLKTIKIFNILAETTETVAPWLVDKCLTTYGSGCYHRFLTTPGVVWRFLTASFRKNRLIKEE